MIGLVIVRGVVPLDPGAPKFSTICICILYLDLYFVFSYFKKLIIKKIKKVVSAISFSS